MLKKITTIFILLSSLLVNAGNKTSSGGLKLNTVVIDAGHGGHDPGALGKHIQEKEITLSIALKLGELIKSKLPEVKVIYTRSTDVFIELKRRAEIANKNDADLFISIHVNSNPNPNASGVDSWVMGQYKNNENFQVAKSENRAILAENNYGSQYEGFDPNSTESYIVFNLMQNAFIGQSLEFATGVQAQVSTDGRKDRGVESAPFLVLWKTTMPSVLVETGFISNEDDEKFLITDEGRDQMANAIFRAFKDYKTKVDNRTKITVVDQPTETKEKSINKDKITQNNTDQAKTSNSETQTKLNEPTISKVTAEPKENIKTTSNIVTPTKNNSSTIKNDQKKDSIPIKNEEKPHVNTVSKTFPIQNQQDQLTKVNNTENIEQPKAIPTISNSTAITQSKTETINVPKVIPTISNTVSQTQIKHNENAQVKNNGINQPKPIPTISNTVSKTQDKSIENNKTVKPIENTLAKNSINQPKAIPTVSNTISQTQVKTNDNSKTTDQPKSITTYPKSTNQQQTITTNQTTKQQNIVSNVQAKPIITTKPQNISNYIPNKDTMNIYFSVQILSSVNKIRLDSSIFNGLDKIHEIKLSGAYKYMVGNELEYNKIVLLKNKTRESFPDAFVVAMKNGLKIPINEALNAKNNIKK